MWTSDELTPRSRTFIPDRGARTFNLARLSHMKRTTDTRCGSRPLTQVYTLTLSHTLSQTHYRAHTTLCHTHLISLSLVHTFMPHTTLSLFHLLTQQHDSWLWDCSLKLTAHSLTHSLTHSTTLHTPIHTECKCEVKWSRSHFYTSPFTFISSLYLSLSYTQTPIRHLLSISLSLRVEHTRNLFWVHIVKLFCYLTFCLFIPFVSHPTFLFLLLLNFFSPFSSFSSIHLKWSKWTSPTYLPT